MKQILFLLGWSLLTLNVGAVAENDPISYTVLLIRGTERDAPDDPKWKPVSERLSNRLSSVFKAKKYWEVSREKVVVQKGKICRTRLNKEREIEIVLMDKDNVEIRLFRDGVLTRRTHTPMTTRSRILGGDKGGDEFWFVVVRREEPQPPK